MFVKLFWTDSFVVLKFVQKWPCMGDILISFLPVPSPTLYWNMSRLCSYHSFDNTVCKQNHHNNSHHWAAPSRHKKNPTQFQSLKLTICSGFRHPWPLPSSVVPAQIAVTMGGWGDGLWEWLDRVSPTPHWPEQQTECTHSTAKDKASAIICGGTTAVCVFCLVLNSISSFLRWSLEGQSGCQSQSDVTMLYKDWLYKEPYSEVQQFTIMGPILTDTAAWNYF